MRLWTIVLGAVASLALTFGAIASGAAAQERERSTLSYPPGASTVVLNGAASPASGRALYVYDKDADGVSKCVGQCIIAWPPLTPAAGAKEGGGWTIITRSDGARQWAYKGRPVYVFYRDKADSIATGAQIIPGWHLAK
jgi:predicted lipoprotein with Yx(FWY)xxD motif